MFTIKLPRSIEERLEKLALRTKSFLVRQAILQHLDDLEDVYLAERALAHIRKHKQPTVPLEDAMKRHSLA
jgi:RHH-type rel operon transcriptional repressor/antitoxin RelB